MKTLNPQLILEKNKLYADQPWIVLLAIEVDDDTTWRLALFPEDVSWNNQTWEAFPAIIEPVSESIDRPLADLRISVSNVTRVVSAYVENTNLLGRTVNIYLIHKGNLDVTSDVLSFTYRINYIETTAQVAVFELGHEDLFMLQFPWQRFIRDKCRFVYKDDRCGFPEDNFGETSTVNLKVGGDGEKGNGWSIINSVNVETADINITNEGELTIQAASGGPYRFTGSYVHAPIIWKDLYGDIDLWTTLSSWSIGAYSAFFLVAKKEDYPTDWVCIRTTDSGDLRFESTNNSTTTTIGTGNLRRSWRIKIEQGIVTAYSSYAEDDSNWTELGSLTRIDLRTYIRVGFGVSTDNDEASGVFSFKHFSGTNDGQPTCDYTLDGPNGCRAHHNTLRFGGFPALPSGRLYGI